jgi:hypothetical protein
MTTEHDVAELCAAIYQEPQTVEWDRLELPPDGIAFGIKNFDQSVAVIFRGSVTLPDWLRDGEAVADPLEHEGLGPIRPGFFAGLPDLWDGPDREKVHYCRS